jgi:putative transcriptional regulator
MTKTYKSDAFAAIHETASGLHNAGVISKSTMREYEELCLSPVKKLSPEEIKIIREKAHVSQAIFARYLNVSTGVISQWERGERSPAGTSLKLLSIVQKKGLDALA